MFPVRVGYPGSVLICVCILPCLVDNDEALAKVNLWFVPKHLTSKQDGVVYVWLIIRCWQVAGSEQVGPIYGGEGGTQGQVDQHSRESNDDTDQ